MADTKLGMDANGSGIDLITGESVVVVLDQHNGYQWEQESELRDNIMKLDGVETDTDDDGNRTRRFTYTATQPGSGTINLALRDVRGEIVERYNVVLQVRG